VEIDVAAYQPEGCRIWSQGGLPVVSLPREVDIANAHLLRSALLEACTGASVVVVDMTITTHFGATGIGVLAPIRKQLQDAGGELRLVIRNAQVLRILEVLKMDQMFGIFTNMPEALAIDRRDSLPYDQAA
jgi:anti-anti-sigma factor